MSDSVFDDIDDVMPPEPGGELVHWMEPRPMSLGAAGVTLTAVGAFALGALAAVTVLSLFHWVGPARELPIRRGRRAA